VGRLSGDTADINVRLWPLLYLEAGASEHCLVHAALGIHQFVGSPRSDARQTACVARRQHGKSRFHQMYNPHESTRCRYCHAQALADQDVIRSMLADQVKGEQGMAQMIQHAEE